MPRAFDLALERRWRERLRNFQRSGLSVREFCRSEAVQEHTFFWWRRELTRRDRVRKMAPPGLRRARRGPTKRRRIHKPCDDGESATGQARGDGESATGQPCGDGESVRGHAPGRRAFVPVQLMAEPLPASCFEFRLGAGLLRVPDTVEEQALRRAIRVLREEVARC